MYILEIFTNINIGDYMSLLFLCIKIFTARLIDVSLGTIRTIFTIKDKHLIASLIGLIEVIVWFLVVQAALNSTENNFFIAFSYSIGFAIGTYIGGIISNKLINTKLGIQVVLNNNKQIINKIRKAGYALSIINLVSEDNKYMLYIQVDSKKYHSLIKLIKKLDSNAFIVVNETKVVYNGYFGIVK